MSAPKTNIEKQERRHKPALGGMAVAVGFAAVLLIGLIVWLTAMGNEPEGAERQVEDTTGEIVDTDTGEVVDEVD